MTVLHENIKAIIITGTTASGKSGIAIELAQVIDGEIISADSTQIYRGFDIGTAKVMPEQQQGVKHHLIDIVEPSEKFSVSRYVEAAEKAILAVENCGKIPIICGGTPQYINALLTGMTFIDINIEPEISDLVQKKLAQIGAKAMWQELQRLDPDTAIELPWQNQRRLTRFFEVYYSTGMTRSEVNIKSLERGPFCRFIPFVLDIPQSEIEIRIAERVKQMFLHGWLNEIEFLLKKYPDLASLPAMASIGYSEVLAAYRSEISLSDAHHKIVIATRQYAKRQRTWFKKGVLQFSKITDKELLKNARSYKK